MGVVYGTKPTGPVHPLPPRSQTAPKNARVSAIGTERDLIPARSVTTVGLYPRSVRCQGRNGHKSWGWDFGGDHSTPTGLRICAEYITVIRIVHRADLISRACETLDGGGPEKS